MWSVDIDRQRFYKIERRVDGLALFGQTVSGEDLSGGAFQQA